MCDEGAPNSPLSVQQERHLKKTNYDSLELISKKPSNGMSEKYFGANREITTEIDVGILLQVSSNHKMKSRFQPPP